MKVSIKINEIDHEHLVDFFSTAFYDSEYLFVRMPSDENVEWDSKTECWEEAAARHILKGGHIDVDDTYSNGEIYSKLGKANPDGECTTYRIGLDDIVRGLEKAANGKFKEASDEDKSVARRLFLDLVEDDGNLDAVGADYLMQIVLFGEVIYG